MNKVVVFSSTSRSLIGFRGQLINKLISLGMEVHVFSPDFQEDILLILNEMGVIVHTVPLERTKISLYSDFQTLLKVTLVLKNIQPNYILSYTIKPVIYGSIAAKIAGVKNIYSLITGLGYAFISLEHPNHKVTNLQKVVFNLYKMALFCSNKVIFQNSDDAELFEKMNLVNNKKINIVNGSGVDLSHYNYDLTILEEYAPEQPIKFLMLGRIIGDKGIREYIAAATELKKKYGTKVIFQLGGGLDTNPTAIQQKELDEWVSTGVIEYLGKLKDVRPPITNSHVFILPSYREGTSRSILEAMSIGRPIVTTNVAGCRQLVEVGRNGYLAEAKSVQSLVDAIEKMINVSSKKLIQMGIYSRKIVEDKYDVHKVNEHMLTIMDIK